MLNLFETDVKKTRSGSLWIIARIEEICLSRGVDCIHIQLFSLICVPCLQNNVATLEYVDLCKGFRNVLILFYNKCLRRMVEMLDNVLSKFKHVLHTPVSSAKTLPNVAFFSHYFKYVNVLSFVITWWRKVQRTFLSHVNTFPCSSPLCTYSFFHTK